MMIFLLKIISSPDRRRELLDILYHVAGPTSIQPGCRACEIYEGCEDDQTVLYMELWENSSELHHHIRSAIFGRILSAMELSTKEPEIRFFEVSQTWGLDLVESLRHLEGNSFKED